MCDTEIRTEFPFLVYLFPQSALEVYREMILLYAEEGRKQVNLTCADLEPWQIIAATILSTLGVVWVKGFVFQQESKF